MNLYLIRHGIAADPAEYSTDAERPLTEVGQQKTRKVAKQLKKLGVEFDLILTSPLVRAQETADILRRVGLSSQVMEEQALAPGGEIKTWLSWLETWRQNGGENLALVGHQPNLSHWAEILVWGKARDQIVLKKAGVIGLILPKTGMPIGNSQLFWLTPPRFLLD